VGTRNLVLLVVTIIACAGCATNVPVAEVRLVGKAFQDLNAASAPLLDDLAVAERAQGKAVAGVRAKSNSRAAAEAISGDGDVRNVATSALTPSEADVEGTSENRCEAVGLLTVSSLSVQNGFCVSDSYYYSELADPPATATFRRSLAAVDSYTNVLLILAEGRNIEAAQAEVQSLAGNVGGVLEIAGATGASAAMQGVVGALKPLLDLAAKQSNAKELARNVKDVSPKVVVVIEQLRVAAPELFNTLTERALASLQRAKLKPDTSAEIVRIEAMRIEAYRTVVSNYVVLLDQYERLLDRLVESYDTTGKVVTLSGLVQQSAQLSAQADAWRRSYSALRMGF
jgi:hypothetical protein